MWVTVFAGSLAEDREQGVIYVMPEHPNPQISGGRFLTPTRSGAVKITAKNGSVFSLVSTRGASFRFDFSSRKYLTPAPALSP